MGSLLENQIAVPSSGGGGGNVFNVGNQFIVTAPTSVNVIRFYNLGGLSTSIPQSLKLWNQDTLEVLASCPAINNDPGVGWKDNPLPTTIDLVTGVTYVVSAFYNGVAWAESADVSAPPAPFQFAANRRRWRNGSDEPLNEQSNGNIFYVDIVEVGDGGGGAADPGVDEDPPTNENISGRLAQWHSSDPEVNTHELDGLLWLTHAITTAVKVGVDEAVGMLEALVALGIAVRFNDAEAIMAAMRAVVDEIALDSQATRDHVQTVGASGFPPLVDQIVEAVGTAPTDLRAPQDTVPLSDPGWIAVDTVLGSGSFLWDQPADRYVLTITAYAPTRSFNEVGGVPYWLHRGFWAVVDFDRVGHYYPIVGHKHMLYEVGSRLPGVLIGLDADIEWTLTAYDYTGEVGP